MIQARVQSKENDASSHASFYTTFMQGLDWLFFSDDFILQIGLKLAKTFRFVSVLAQIRSNVVLVHHQGPAGH